MDRSVYLARALSLAALAVCVAAFVAILLDGAARAPASGGSQIALERLETAANRLASAAAGLGHGTSGQRVRRAIHVAIAANNGLRAQLKRARAAGLPAEPRLANAVEAHYEYLDALGSVLVNPRSTLRAKLDERARRARAALSSLSRPGSLPESTRAWRYVAAYAAARGR